MQDLDDLPHPVGPETNFNESMYFQFGEPASGLNGFLRLANRPNEGRGERTVCLFLPDGRVAFSFARPRFERPDVFDAAGLAIEIDDPFVRQTVRFEGPLHLLSEPSAMSDPKVALATSPRADAAITLRFDRAATEWAGSLDAEGTFVSNHYEQFMTVTGTVAIDGVETTVRGRGIRDHSWGPRSWQAPWFYRWVHGSCDGFGIAAGILGKRDEPVVTGGFAWADGAIHVLDKVDVRTCWDERGEQMSALDLTAFSGDRSWTLTGEVHNSVPLRHRAADGDGMTRILENAVRWTWGTQQFPGIAEYLDQIVDGRAIGVSAYDE